MSVVSAIAKIKRRRSRLLAALIGTWLIALTAGCGPLGELLNPAPGVTDEWAGLLNEIRAFERTLGFAPTANFGALSREQPEFPFCGFASRLILPYSYEDPAITWSDAKTEQECRVHGGDADLYFGAVEAWGESATPVTPAMITGKLDRFIYLVIHEDCHDQFDLPYGIEEPLCNLITYKAMDAFAAQKYGRYAREHRAVQRYADTQSDNTRATIAHYERLATVYAKYDRGETSTDALMRERGEILQTAARQLAWTQGDAGNVRIANSMTYSRHYPFLEQVFDTLGRDTARTVAFFKRVDAAKPSRDTVVARDGDSGVAAIRAYEAAVISAISAALATGTSADKR
jgi:hypothetical protein